MLDVQVTLTVHVPQLIELATQLASIGGQLVAVLDEIKAEVVRLNEGQAAQVTALSEQLTAIAVELEQIAAGIVSTEELGQVAQELRTAATLAEDQADAIRANTVRIQGMVPDAPTP